MTDEQNRRLSCCPTFDFDAMSAWIGTFQSENPSMISRGEFGATVGLARILDLLEGHDIRATFCIPGHTARLPGPGTPDPRGGPRARPPRLGT